MDDVYKICPKCGEKNFKNNYKCRCGFVFEESTMKPNSQKSTNIIRSTINSESDGNKIGGLLTKIAWIMYGVGLITGLIVVALYDFTTALIVWVSSFLTGTNFLGFAEIIKLLHQIANKQK